MTKPLNTVAMTSSFLAQAKDEGMTEAEIQALVDILAVNPMAGNLIQGSGGCRKVRLAKTGGGKSGGYRVVTFYAPPEMPVYAFAVLSKSDRATFTPEEVAGMANLAKRILSAHRKRA